MVLTLFTSLSRLIKLDHICIDNNVFRLHYKLTVILLLAFSLLVTSTQFFGEPIHCIETDKIPEKLLNTFCWIHSTFTLPDALNKKVGVEVPAPGIDTYVEGEKRVYHNYYQWVSFVLFIQSLLFYAPRYLWVQLECGKLERLVMGLDNQIVAESSRRQSIDMLVHYMRRSAGTHNMYFYGFVVCEVINFCNVLIQMCFIDTFLGGEFTTYGLQVLRYSELDMDDRVDPMVRVFPRMTKCNFYQFGPSGDVKKHDTLCLLPLNIVNEKVYIFLWFWLYALALVSALLLVYRLAIIVYPHLRYVMLRSRATLVESHHLQVVLHNGAIGDWFILYMLAKNIDGQHYKELVGELSDKLVECGAGGNGVVCCRNSYKGASAPII